MSRRPDSIARDNKTGAPVVSALGVPIAELVHEAHEEGVPAMQARMAAAGLDGDADLTAILDYCGLMQCADDNVTCPGCQRAMGAKGIKTIDQFVAAHREIHFTDTGAALQGGGTETATFANVETFTRTWSGEAYWFWARRVLRKVRYGIRKQGALSVEDDAGASSDAPSVILMEPQIPDNIGMVARAMGNFALDDLRVIKPRDGWPSEKARAVASGAAALIDRAGCHETLGEAIGDLNWVCATTARQRDMRKPVLTPEQAATEMHTRIGRGEKCGILFGRERNGLESDEVADADAIVMIPVNSAFASLNLAQAVLLVGYEWLKISGDATLGRVTRNERNLTPGLDLGRDQTASKQNLLGFFEHLEDELERLGFFYPAARRHVVVRNLRNMFARMEATEQEVRTLRGIVATLAHGKGKGRKLTE